MAKPRLPLPTDLLEDVSKVASGALGTLAGARDQAESSFRRRVDRVLDQLDVVPRDEFEAVKAVASKARLEQEALVERVAALEERLATLEAAAKPADAKPAPKKRAPRKAATKSDT